MKKAIFGIVLLAALGAGYWYVRSHPINLGILQAQSTRVGRGDLTIPINASGDIEPTRRVPIKSNASGEVIEVAHKAGERVAKGDLLVLLKRDDEQRSVDRAQADVDRARANLRRAEISLEERKSSSRMAAKARVDQLKAQIEYAKFNATKMEELKLDGSNASVEEALRARTSFEGLQAQLAGAEADLKAAETTAVELAQQDIALAEATLSTTQASLADAQQRLTDTRIVAPIDGMVADVNTHVGEVIQGGKNTITGGTVLAVLAEVDRIYVKTEVDEADIGVVRELAPESARPQLALADVQARLVDDDPPREGDDDEPEVPITGGSRVRITVEAFHEEDFFGEIERIYPEPKKGSSIVTYLVDILITSPNRDRLMLGMHADVEFTAKSVRNVLLVKHDAIRRGPNDKDLGVFVPSVGADGKTGEPKFVKCRFGLDNGVFAEVVEGLEQNQEVYTKLPQKTEAEEEKERSRS